MNNLNFGWVKGDTVNLGVGQGYMSATPIQLAYYAALLANKGTLNEFSFVQDSEETTLCEGAQEKDYGANKP